MAPHGAGYHGYLGRSHVAQHHGYQEGSNPAGAAFSEYVVLLGEGQDAADAAADDGADAEGVFGGQVEAGLATGFLGGDGGELGEAVHAPAFLALQVVLRVKALHLGGEGGIEPFGVKGGDVVDAGIALDDAGPG